MGILEIAGGQAKKAGASVVEEIELEIGELAAVEPGAFEFAWSQGVKGTLLENAVRVVHRVAGQASCLDCSHEFDLHHLYDPCPVCGGHFIRILRGRELRVKSLVVT